MNHARFIAHAGAPGTRANVYELRWQGRRILLDCGAPFSEWSWEPGAPDAVVLTHAHLDHVAGLASLREAFPQVEVWASPATRRALGSALTASLGGPRACAIMDTVRTQKFHESFSIGGIEARLVPAGHTPGAAMVALEVGGAQIVYTGDLSVRPLLSAGAAELEAVATCDVLILETVLAGARALEGFDPAQELEAFGQWLGFEGPKLVVADAVGEADEVAEMLRRLEVPRWWAHENCGQAGAREEAVDQAAAMAALDRGEVVLVAGGDLKRATAAYGLARRVLERSEARIALFNGVRRGTLAETLVRTPRRARVLGEPGRPRLKARVRRWEWPLHPGFEELVEAVRRVGPSKVVLVHGERKACYRLRTHLKRSMAGVEVMIPEPQAWLDLGVDG